MKKALVILASLMLITSCATIKPAQRIVTTGFIDYQEFSKEEFMLSPDPYIGEFEPIGELKINIVPALKSSQVWGQSAKITRELVTYQEMAQIAVSKAKGIGADALVNFEIKIEPRYPTRKDKNWCNIQYFVSGFCIDRK